jgi:hypothetical protein
VDCLAEGSKIVIDACEVFLLCMLRPPASSSSTASTVVSDRFSTPSPLSACQSPYEDVPPVPAKLISILQVSHLFSNYGGVVVSALHLPVLH